MTDGVWQDADILFTGNGTAGSPITLRARTPGQVILSGNSRLRLSGSYLVVDGLQFKNGYIFSGDVVAFQYTSSSPANNCRLTDCAIIDYSPPDATLDTKYISLYGVSNRVDHCYLKGKSNLGSTVVVWVDARPDNPNYHRIDHNYFGPRPPLAVNGGETIRVGTSDISFNLSRTTVENNYFEQCNGDVEIISSKSCENTYRHNTFVDCEGALSLRHGNRSAVYGNYFFGHSKPFTGGVRIVGEDHQVYNNYFADLGGSLTRGPLSIMQGIVNSPLNGYFQVQRATVAFNTFVNCSNNFLIGLSGTLTGTTNVTTTLPPVDCTIANNLVLASRGKLVDQRIDPVNMTWQGNIMYGTTLGITTNSGISQLDPKLVLAPDGLWRPEGSSPAISGAQGTYDFVTEDMEGQPRPVAKDVGCDQLSIAPIAQPPLKATDAGPLWMQTASTVLSWSTPADITYGTALSVAQLNAMANVPGTFAYTPVAGSVLSAGNGQTLSVMFVPNDTVNYSAATQTVTINVLKATPIITWPPPANIVYGAALGSAQLKASANVPGTLAYAPPAGTVLNAGNGQTLSVTFTPVDSTNYNTATQTVMISVMQATPVITWSNPAAISNGTVLSSAQLNATANVPGSFIYAPPAGTVLNAGSGQTLSVTFLPSDAANYATASRAVTINVTSGGKLLPIITWPTPDDITYGTPLGNAQLNATADVPGTFVYTPVAGTLLSVANGQTLSVNFTPNDTNSYTVATKTVTINVAAGLVKADVHVAYLIPTNRVAQSNGVASLQRVMLMYQGWFRDQMVRNGFAPKTFALETEADGVTPRIHTVLLAETDSYLRNDIFGGRVIDAALAAGVPVGAPGQLWLLVPEIHLENPDGTLMGGLDSSYSYSGSGIDPGWAIVGSDSLALCLPDYLTNNTAYDGITIANLGPYPLKQDISFFWYEGTSLSSVSSAALGFGLHELAEALGLDHDYRNDENFNGNLTGQGFRGIRGVLYPALYPYNYTRLSYGAALALNVSPYFNSGQPASDNTKPTLSVATSGTRSPANGLLRITFTAADAGGLSAAFLSWHKDYEQLLVEEMSLAGTALSRTFATAYYDPGVTNQYTISVLDRQGNKQSVTTTIYPVAGLNNGPQPFIRVTPPTAGLGEDVVFDASATFDPEHDASLLEVEWDVDGDGVFDTLPTTSMLFTNRYLTLGNRLVRARLTDPAGAAAVSAPVAVGITLCPAVLSPTYRSHGYGTGTGTVKVVTGGTCIWTVVNTNNWITITSGANRTGNGSVSYSVDSNPAIIERTGALLIADQWFPITQQALPCTYTLSPTNRIHGNGATTGSVSLSTKSACPWTVINTNSWITMSSATTGAGSASISYTLSANADPNARAAVLLIAGQPFMLSQWGTTCLSAVSPANPVHGAGVTTGVLSVATGSKCDWTASNTNDWITITSSTSGTGNGSVTYQITANMGLNARSGALSIGGALVTVTQLPCLYEIAPTNWIHDEGWETGVVSVTTDNGCAWNVLNTNDWIGFIVITNDTGNGSVSYTVAANTGLSARTGFLSIGGELFTVTQLPCRYDISMTNATHSYKPENGSVEVTASGVCPWLVVNTNSWIRITAGANGAGNGSVNYTVNANPVGSARSGMLSIAGLPFYVTQMGVPCTYSISPSDWIHGEAWDVGAVDVTAGIGCPWSVDNPNAWITILSGLEATGAGSVIYTVDANPGPARSGTITIAGLDYTVEQESGVHLVRATDTMVASGQTNCLPVVLESHGNENAVGFSLCYDTNLLTIASARLGGGLFGATLSIDNSQVAMGRVGMTVAMPSGWSISGGNQTMVEVCFRGALVSGNVTTPVTICDLPIGRRLVDVFGQPLPVSTVNGSVTVVGPCTLGVAVDTPQLVWTTGGGAPWACQTNVTHDGQNAAASGTIGDGLDSWMETTVTGPGTVSFWWKVSSEPSNDQLRFYSGGSQQLSISGEVGWQWQSFSVPSGSQALRWRYIKNSSLASGQDRGWLDQVQFSPAAPVITGQPVSQNADAGSTVSLNVVATGTPPMTYQWWYNGTALVNGGNLRGATTATLTLSNAQPAQSGTYWVVVSNAVGSVSSSYPFVSVTPLLALVDALDIPNWTWTTSGTPPWVGQPVVTHDGVSAARSGAIGNSQTTSMQATVNGPGTVSFWWKVSSQTNADLLLFYVGTAEQARISGEVDWQWLTFNIPSGSQVLKWTYSKNSSGVAGQDRGWVDQVQFGPMAPALSSQPVSQSVDAGVTASFTVAAGGTPPLSYQWLCNGTNLVNGGSVSGATTASLTLSNVQPAQTGSYSVLVSNAAGSLTSSNGLLSVTPLLPLAVAVNATNLVWTTSGSPPWVGQAAVTHDGVGAARSGAIGNSLTTSLLTTVNGPGLLSFWWKVSSEPSNDQLRFYLGGSQQLNISGEVDWQWRTFSVASGSQVLEWRYTKNSSTTAGQDRGWVDEVLFIPTGVPLAPVIEIQPLSQTVVGQTTVTFKVGAVGSTPLGYQWQFNGTNLINGGNVSGATTTNLTLTSVQGAQAGTYSVVVSNAAGSVTSSNVLLTVVTVPVITSQPVSQSVAAGTTITFNVAAIGVSPLSYQWRSNGIALVNGGKVSGASTATLGLSSVQAAQAGTYSVVVSNAAGSVTSSPVQLIVSSPPAIISQPANQTVVAGTNVTFNVNATGTPPLGYQWRFFGTNLADGGNVSGATSASLTISNVQAARAGIYSVVGSNAVGSVTSSNALLTVIMPPVITRQPASQSLDAGMTVSLSVAVTGTLPLSYQWQFNGVTLADGGSASGTTTSNLFLANAQPAQSGAYSVVVSNAAGTVTSSNAVVKVAAPLALEDALDAPYLVWTTSVSAPWVAQTNVTFDGDGAARSGSITNSQTTWLATTVMGPGTVRFWWKVSSQTNQDLLQFYVDGVAWATISGELDWQWQTFDVPGGTRVLQWVYSKDNSAGSGQDRGWVGEVQFTFNEGPTAPVIMSQPVSQDLVPGANVTLQVVASGSEPLGYQWRFNGVDLVDGNDISGATSARLSLANAQVARSGAYTVVVRNPYSLAISSNALLTVIPPLSLAEALDTPQWVWIEGGYSAWMGETSVTYDGMDAVQSGTLAASQTNWIETTVIGPGTVSFWWKVSSETNHDFLRFSVNGGELAHVSGEVDWRKAIINMPNGGNQVLRWSYTKDSVGSAGKDRGWVDQVQFGPMAPVITNQPSTLTVVDEGTTVKFKIDAMGSPPFSYFWLLNGTNMVAGTNVSAVTGSRQLTLSNALPAQSGTYSVMVSNAGGITFSANAVLNVIPGLPLADALNTTNWVWSIPTNAYSFWVGETSVTHDGVMAARNGTLPDSHTASMQTTINGPGTLKFWWKVSSETNLDILTFSVNGSALASISGEVDWQQRSFDLGAGPQLLQFDYKKNIIGTNGQDRAWVDQVQFGPSGPIITNQPVSQVVDAGTTAKFTVGSRGTPPLGYQWRFNGVNLVDGGTVSGSTAATLTLSSVQSAQAGNYSVVVSNAAASVVSPSALLTVTPVVPLAVALDAANLVWTTSGSPPWVGQPVISHDGVSAARIQGVADGQSTSMQATLTGPGTLSYWWKVSSQTNGDLLSFYIGSSQQASISGEVDWQQRTFTIPVGSQTVKWTYSKNSSGFAGQDRAWVDQVLFSPTPVAFTTQPVSQTLDAGASTSFTVVASGTPPLSYQWRFNGLNLVDGGSVRGATTATLTLTNLQPAQSGSYSVLVSNPGGSLASASALLTVTPLLALAEALDTPTLTWTTSGTPPWVGQPVVTHDGVDAARSGAIGNSQTTAMQTTVNGPGTVSFWWKISSETNNDYLAFTVGTAEQARISGEVDWQWRSFSVPAGSQVLKWTYTKNSSTVAGQDRAWVDQVVYGIVPPTITSQPVSQTAETGATVTFAVGTAGTPPLSYQWQLNGVNLVNGSGISGATTASLSISNVQPAQAGSYSVVVSSSAGSVTSAGAGLTVVPLLPLADALDTANLVWTTSGSPPWVGQQVVTHDGVDAARSGAIGNSQSTAMQTTVNGPGTVSFWWKVSSEPNNDYLAFAVGTTEQARISGEVDWQWRTFDIPSGSQVLKWTYTKNASTVQGQDRAWVDQVQFGLVPAAITTQPASQNGGEGGTVTFKVVVVGTPPLSYQWMYNGTSLANDTNVSGATSASLTLSNLQPAQAGTYSVVVGNALGNATSSDATLRVLGLAEAVDALSLVFSMGGDASWIAQTSVTHDGVDAAQSGAIADGLNTRLETWVNGPGTVSFWWKVSSEPVNDQLRFYVGAVEQARISGEVDWQFQIFSVPAGTQLLKWRYSKNASIAAGQDRGWVDQVAFVGSAFTAGFASGTTKPVVARIANAQSAIVLTWNTNPGKTYQVFYTDSLSSPLWKSLSGEVLVNGSVATQQDMVTGQQQRFYQVIEQ